MQKGFSHVCFTRFFNPHPTDDLAPGFAFYPPTNFNKVTLSDSSAQQQRQGVSGGKASELEKALLHFLKSLRGAKQLGLEEKNEIYVHGLQQLQKWEALITAYLAFFSNNGQGIVGLVPAKLKTCLIAAVYNSDSARHGLHINTTVPLAELIENREQSNFDVHALIIKWEKLQRRVKRLIPILEVHTDRTSEACRRKVLEAIKALNPSTQ